MLERTTPPTIMKKGGGGPLFGLFLQSFFIGITMRILSIVIFVIVYGRMIEIYMMVSLAPVPMATWGNHEQSHVGQNYLRSLFALGFQGFLILICVANLRCSAPECCNIRGCHQLDLEHRGVYRAALLLAVQDQLCRQNSAGCPLIRR